MKKHTPPFGRLCMRGFAALTLVMVLFFIMALVAAYTNRNLIFEQRISANTYRASKSLNAVEGGLDWTLAMLNGGRVDKDCQPSSKTTDDDFRRRYYFDVVDPAAEAGSYQCNTTNLTCQKAADSAHPSCISRGGVLSCTCPTAKKPDSTLALPPDGQGSTFRVSFLLPSGASHSGAIRAFVRGCANPGDSTSGCLMTDDDAATNVDAVSMGIASFGLVRALPVPPKATLTAGRAIIANSGMLSVGNGDDVSGLTAHAPTITLNGSATPNFRGPAGSGGSGQAVDAALGTLRGAGASPSANWFNAMFGMPIDLFKRQPALVPCPGNCDQATLQKLITAFPRNPIWIEGDLDLNSAAKLGDATDPVMLIVTGTLTLGAQVDMVGFVHANNISWNSGAKGATFSGAMVAATDFTAADNATLSYNKGVMEVIRLRYGSFVRIPGGWDIVYERPGR